MNDQTPRKNDLALVVGLKKSNTGLPLPNGLIVKVMTDPALTMFYDGATELANECEYRGFLCNFATRCLIRIPPPSESQTLFADEPVERGVSV